MIKDKFKEERLKVLELLAQGKISALDAEKLLDAFNQEEASNQATVIKTDKKMPFRMLKIVVDSKDGDKVRVQIPIEFAKLLKKGKFGNINLNEMDIDIDSILEMVETGVVGELVSVDSEDGDIVRIIIE